MANAFQRSWTITKLSFHVIKEDKELLLFPLLGGFFSLLFIALMIFPTLITFFLSGITPLGEIARLPIIFIIYFGLAFIATFFNVCVVYTTKRRFEAKNATFGESIKFSLSRIHLVLYWSVISATVGIILRIIEHLAEKSGLFGKMFIRILTGILGMLWSIVTVFVVPAMVYNNIGPFDAIKKSTEALKKTWGESLIRYYGLGIIQFVLFIIGIIGTFFLVFISFHHPILIGVIIIFAILYFTFLITFFSVANTIFNTALFVYASKGKLPKGYSKEIMSGAFTFQKKNI